jgi:hypothetical protein
VAMVERGDHPGAFISVDSGSLNHYQGSFINRKEVIEDVYSTKSYHVGEYGKELEERIRLQTQPLAVKVFAKGTDIPEGATPLLTFLVLLKLTLWPTGLLSRRPWDIYRHDRPTCSFPFCLPDSFY